VNDGENAPTVAVGSAPPSSPSPMATAPPNHTSATHDDIHRLEQLIEEIRHDMDVQFTRITQL
jgi:hypothetical protein